MRSVKRPPAPGAASGRTDADKARELGGFQVVSVTKDGEELKYVYPTAALESWGDVVRVHAMVVFPIDPKDRALSNGRKFAAELFFPKE